MASRRTLTDGDRRVPLLGFCAYSGTGKTTLLRRLLPRLNSAGLRVAMIKHAHHDFEIDHPGKDSYELRHAGACQMLVASRRRMALIEERNSAAEPTLEELLARLELSRIDLVLVEGFKHGDHPKIELHRAGLGRPWLFPDDPSVIALACDDPEPPSGPSTVLDLNDLDQITGFVLDYAAPDDAGEAPGGQAASR
jgi:molybdopterin-guanine dinucleotide biosynthesis protein MobB